MTYRENCDESRRQDKFGNTIGIFMINNYFSIHFNCFRYDLQYVRHFKKYFEQKIFYLKKLNVTATLYIFAFINQNEFYHYKLKQGFSLMIFFRFNLSITRVRTFVPCCQVLSSTMVDQAFAKKFYNIKFGMQHDRYFWRFLTSVSVYERL